MSIIITNSDFGKELNINVFSVELNMYFVLHSACGFARVRNLSRNKNLTMHISGIKSTLHVNMVHDLFESNIQIRSTFSLSTNKHKHLDLNIITYCEHVGRYAHLI